MQKKISKINFDIVFYLVIFISDLSLVIGVLDPKLESVVRAISKAPDNRQPFNQSLSGQIVELVLFSVEGNIIIDSRIGLFQAVEEWLHWILAKCPEQKSDIHNILVCRYV